MAVGCKNRELLQKIMRFSVSCSAPDKGRWRKTGPQSKHCGYCLPCLIRRAALVKAFGKNDSTIYWTDLGKTTLSTKLATGVQVRSFQLAVRRLKQNSALAKIWIHSAGSLLDESKANIAQLEKVYRRGLMEVGAIVTKVKTSPD